MLKITYLSNKVGMSYTSGILKHTQIRKFIMMQGEREKTSPKIEKSMSDFWKKINTLRTSFEPAVKLCKYMLISTSGSLPTRAQPRHRENQVLPSQILVFDVLH